MIKHACLLALLALSLPVSAQDAPAVTFREVPGQLSILVSGKPFAEYVYADKAVPRPFFCRVTEPGNTQVRHHGKPLSPPVAVVQQRGPLPAVNGVWCNFFPSQTSIIKDGEFIGARSSTACTCAKAPEQGAAS